jgi:hypothetical protein
VAESGSGDPPAERLERALAGIVHVGDRDRPFAEFGPDEARSLAAALGDLPIAMRARVGPVSTAWKQLATELEKQSAATVAELEPRVIVGFAERLWVIPPPGSLLGPPPD